MIESLNTNIAFLTMTNILRLKNLAILTVPISVFIYLVLSSLFFVLLYTPGSLRAVTIKLITGVTTIMILRVLPKVQNEMMELNMYRATDMILRKTIAVNVNPSMCLFGYIHFRLINEKVLRQVFSSFHNEHLLSWEKWRLRNHWFLIM